MLSDKAIRLLEQQRDNHRMRYGYSDLDLGVYIERLESVTDAARTECAKFRFPEEDRTGIWTALQALDGAK